MNTTATFSEAEDIDAIVAQTNIAAFIGARFPRFWPNGSENVKTVCPFCQRPTFSISTKRGTWNCKDANCNQTGTLAQLVEYQDNCDFVAAKEIIKKFNGTGHRTVTPKMKKSKDPWNESKIVATYDYTDEAGKLLYECVRFDPKDFRPRVPDGNGGWITRGGCLNGVRRVLYNLPLVIDAVAADELIYVCEGEKDADAINGVDGSGFVATTAQGGTNWRPEYNESLRGARVCIIADNDEAGRKHALDVAHHLKGIAKTVDIKMAKTGKDAFDHLAAGHGVEDFVAFEMPSDATKSAADALPAPANLYGDTFKPNPPEFDVSSLLRRSGLVLVWSAPGGLKTHTTLGLVHQMLVENLDWRNSGPAHLFEHPALSINRRWRRVLWVATEECGDELRYQAGQVLKGLGRDVLDGELHYLFASEAGNRITLDDLPTLIERDGPWDAIVLDSLTGLRPKVVNGQAVKWDLDNDAANEMCLTLRGLAAKHQVCFLILHHSGRDTTRYRGAVDWWASADTMFGLTPDNGRVKIEVEKVRGGKKPGAFTLDPEWNADGSFTLTYSGTAATANLTPTAKTMAAFLKGRGKATQAELTVGAGCVRSTGQTSLRALVAAGIAKETGETKGRSPVFAYCPEVSDSTVGHYDGKG